MHIHLASDSDIGWAVTGLSTAGGWFGGVFPDAVEKIGTFYWIEHRTITHWVPLWIGIAAFVTTFSFPASLQWYEPFIYPFALGFVLGGLTHLVFDWPNPSGIPFLSPWSHHSLNLWRSGTADLIIVIAWYLSIWGYWKYLN